MIKAIQPTSGLAIQEPNTRAGFWAAARRFKPPTEGVFFRKT